MMRDSRGVSLTELIVAMVIVTMGIAGAMGSFRYISRALGSSRTKTIATNLVQEKMEVLKNKSYFQLLVTTNAATSSGYNPNFTYDVSFYAPETFTLWGGAPLTRVVNIDYASVSGTTISTMSFSSSDPGLKKITVTVYWDDNGSPRKVSMESYMANTSVATLSTSFKGQVRIAGTGANLGGATVQVLGIPKWRAATDGSGNYSFQVAPGSYTLVASSQGFFSQATALLSVVEGVATTQNFSLTEVATGTVKADQVYSRLPSLVISQVVASTVQFDTGYDVQFIELYNPTTDQISVSQALGWPAAHNVNLNFETVNPANSCADINLVYVSSYVPSGGYYLISNTQAGASFTFRGRTMVPSAYYKNMNGIGVINGGGSCASNQRVPEKDNDGAVYLTDTAGGTIDAVGWRKGGDVPTRCEGSCLGLALGFLEGDQVVRFSTACSASSVYGRAYDTGNNGNDFYYNNGVIMVTPAYDAFDRTSPRQLTMGGRPSTGSYVWANDGNSSGLFTTDSLLFGPAGQQCSYSSFTLVGVATGTWTVNVVHSDRYESVSTVTVTPLTTTGIFNAVSSPSWYVNGMNYVMLASTYSGGLAVGLVKGVGGTLNTPIKNILMNGAGQSVRTDNAGSYALFMSTGSNTIYANFNQDNSNYQTAEYTTNINQGAVSTIPDFHIGQGGFIRGWVTSGSGALPNIVVNATLNGTVRSDTSDGTGYFVIFVETGTTDWTIEPDVDPLSSYTSLPTDPLTDHVTTPGTTVFTGTITVIGALGTLTGRVLDGGSAITTGVLVVASTGTITDPPAAVVASSTPALAPQYAVSSQADGYYYLEVRASTSTTYNLRAFYPVVNINTGAVSYTSKTKSGYSVVAGSATSVADFTWP